MQTVYQRLYANLIILIPQLESPMEGAEYYAPPRVAGEMALHCAVSKVDETTFEVEIAHDELKGGQIQPAPWLTLRADSEHKTAELLVLQDQWSYEVVMSDRSIPNPRRSAMTVASINHLAMMINLGGAFRAVDALTTENI